MQLAAGARALFSAVRGANAARKCSLPSLPARCQSTGFARGKPKAFLGYSLRKVDGQLTIKVVQPKFRVAKEGTSVYRSTSEGYIRLTAMNILPAQGSTAAKLDLESGANINLHATDVITFVQAALTQPLTINKQSENKLTGRVSMRKLEIVPSPGPAPAPAAGQAVRTPIPSSFKVTITEDGATASATIQQSELFILRNLAGVSIPWITGWQVQLDHSLFDPAVHMAADRPPGAPGFAPAHSPSYERASSAPSEGAFGGRAGGSSSMRELGNGMKAVERKSGKGPILVREPGIDSPPGAKAEFAPMPSGETIDSISPEAAEAAFQKAAAKKGSRFQ